MTHVLYPIPAAIQRPIQISKKDTLLKIKQKIRKEFEVELGRVPFPIYISLTVEYWSTDLNINQDNPNVLWNEMQERIKFMGGDETSMIKVELKQRYVSLLRI